MHACIACLHSFEQIPWAPLTGYYSSQRQTPVETTKREDKRNTTRKPPECCNEQQRKTVKNF